MGATYPEPYADKVVVELRNKSAFDQKCTLSIRAKCATSDRGIMGMVSSGILTKTLRAGREMEVKFDFKKSMDRMRLAWRDENSLITEVVVDSLVQDCQRINSSPNPRPHPNPFPTGNEREIKDAVEKFKKYLMEGNLPKVKLAVNSGKVDVNELILLDTWKAPAPPLQIATSFEHVAIIKYFLSLPDIEVNKTGGMGSTALSTAAAIGNVDLVKLFLAQPGIDINKPDFYGQTPLSLAFAGNHMEIVELLRNFRN